MRRFSAFLAVMLLGMSLTAGVSAGSPHDEGVRILLSADSAKANGLAVRNRFGGRVTTEVSQAQLKELKKRGITYELIPLFTIEPEPGKTSFDAVVTKKGKGRPVPVTQVPWGIKAVYGNPILGPSGVSGGAGVVVAVLDTGSVDHPDFYRADGSSVIAQCVDFTDKKVAIVEGSCADGHGHGTHVTGTVAAAGGVDGQGIFGVAPNADIYSYKVLTDKGGGYADDIALGIRTAADRGAQVISMSFGLSTASSLVQEAVQYAASKGVLLIAAAGNSGPSPDSIGYPAAFPAVVAVGALNPDEVVSTFSSRGISDGSDLTVVERELEVVAPGAGIISIDYKKGYSVKSGTSMAAPHVAGLAAKGWQGSADQTRAWLVGQAEQHDIIAAEGATDAGVGYDPASGYGLPQVTPLSQSQWSN